MRGSRYRRGRRGRGIKVSLCLCNARASPRKPSHKWKTWYTVSLLEIRDEKEVDHKFEEGVRAISFGSTD
jgi:hypothetical protein